MRIDFHSHLYQKEYTIEALAVSYKLFKGYGFYERMMEKILKINTIETDNVIEKVIFHNKKVGIDRVVLLPVNYKENRVVKDWYNYASDLFIPFYNPPEKIKDDINEKEVIEAAVKVEGYKGFKIMLSFREKKLNDEILIPSLEIASKYKIPILMHTGYPPPGTQKSVLTYSNPIFIEDYINSFPKVNIVIAHMGFPWTDIAIALATQYPNIYLDVSNLTYMMPGRLKNLLVQAKEIMGVDKILFGSDGFLPEMIEIAVNYFEKTNFLTKEEINKILGENAQKLLTLN